MRRFAPASAWPCCRRGPAGCCWTRPARTSATTTCWRRCDRETVRLGGGVGGAAARMGGLGRPAVGARLPAAVAERDRLGAVGRALHAAVAGCRDRPRDAARVRAGGDPRPGRVDPTAAPAWLRSAVYPLLVASQSIPVVAIAPLLVIYLGFGLSPKALIVALVCFFPITANALDGFASAPA